MTGKKRLRRTGASVHSAVVVPGNGKLNSPPPSDGVCKRRWPPWRITSTAAANWPADRGIVGAEKTLRSSAENMLMPEGGGQDETMMCTCSTHPARARRRQRPVMTARRQRDRPRGSDQDWHRMCRPGRLRSSTTTVFGTDMGKICSVVKKIGGWRKTKERRQTGTFW